jgi:hypothetical protein
VNAYRWVDNAVEVDWEQLSELYRVAPVGIKHPSALAAVFANSMFICFVYRNDCVVGAGRALADGLDCPTSPTSPSIPTTRDAVSGGRSSNGSWPRPRVTRRSSSTPIPAPNASTPSWVPFDEHGDGDLAGPSGRSRIGDTPEALKDYALPVGVVQRCGTHRHTRDAVQPPLPAPRTAAPNHNVEFASPASGMSAIAKDCDSSLWLVTRTVRTM